MALWKKISIVVGHLVIGLYYTKYLEPTYQSMQDFLNIAPILFWPLWALFNALLWLLTII